MSDQNPKKFLNRTRAARLIKQFGWDSLTSDQVHRLFMERREWSLLDSANVERIADALESIAKSMKQRSTNERR